MPLDAAIAALTESTEPPPATGPLSGAINALMTGGPASMTPKPAAPLDLPDARRAPKTMTRDLVQAIPQVGAGIVSGVGNSIIGGFRGLTTLATGGGLDAAVEAVHGTDGGAVARAYEPAEGSMAGKGMEALASPYSPLAWPAIIAKRGGEIAQGMGASPAVATAVETGLTAVPFALIPGGKGRAPLAKPVAGAPAAGATLPGVTVSPALEAPSVTSGLTGAPLSTGRATVPAAPQSTAAVTGREFAVPLAAAEKPMQTTTGAAIDGATAKFEPPKFTEPPPAAEPGVSLPKAEQAKRAAILERVGIPEARLSAISGDGMAAATDYQTTRLNNAAGAHMKGVIDAEKAALEQHATNIVRDTGGTLGTDGSTLYNRGHAIIAPLEDLRSWFDEGTKRLYKLADERAGDTPVAMPETHKLFSGDKAEFLGTTEGESLLKGATARMKSLGMLDAEGAPQAVTVKQAEQLKQYLNNQWSPRTSRLIRSIKDAVDDDVTKWAGEDVYRAAREMRRSRAVTLDDPKGIAKLMDADGPDGINRAVSVEKIADTVAGMPKDQLAHIVRTLRNVPEELRPQADAALQEIKAHFANQVLDKGAKGAQWNAREVTRFLKNNAAKLPEIFSEQELAKLKDLSDAGHILAKDTSYPGAAAQEYNLVRRGVMAGLRSAAAGVGGFLAGPAGAIAGNMAGEAAASRLGEASALRGSQKRVIKLSDFPK